jgi:hypothetical protein
MPICQTKKQQQHSMDMFNKVSEMVTTTNLTIFRSKKDDVINDLSKIRFGIKEKIRQCSI